MKRLVLVGAGHAHAEVLRALSGQGGVEVVLVSPGALAPYSGMIPGWMAGYYSWEECCIDAGKLCRATGARFVPGLVRAIDTDAKTVRLADGAGIGYDLLSLDIGATARPVAGDAERLVAMRPLDRLKAHWDRLRAEVCALPAGRPYRVLMVGGGAAGVESLLAVRRQLSAWAPGADIRYVLATSGHSLLPGLAGRAGRLAHARLRRHGIDVVAEFDAHGVDGAGVRGRDGRLLGADIVLWATGAGAHAWPAAAGLAQDDAGFIRVDAMLRSVSHPEVFAGGDCAGLPEPVPKAGVFAVRMGPVLAHNLRAALHGLPLKAYRPQHRNLVLLGTGDGSAIASWGPFAWEGTWVWRWKERIDRRFLARYNNSGLRSA
jgi:pyridine nucleotide-disulfide oxidoreductase family protein